MGRSLKWTILASWVALPAVVRGGLDALETSNATTGVVCQSTFSWMNNQSNQSPCLVAAALSGVCATAAGWDVPALGPIDAYSLPNSSTANPCVCSWAVYNLLGACTICQGNPHVDNWSPYKAGCGSFTTNTYWPADYTTPNNTFLPFWAATDPSAWSSGNFNPDDAASIHSQGKSDINLSPSLNLYPSQSSTTNSSSNAGVIAAGAIGGLAVVVGLIALFFYLRHIKRHKSQKLALLDPLPPNTSYPIHSRSLSDASHMIVKGSDPVGFSSDFRPTTSPPNMYTSSANIASVPWSHTSVHSLPYDLSIINGPASTSPPPPPSQQAMLSSQASIGGGHPQVPLENVIVPYTITSPTPLSTDRKRADGNLFTIFEQQDEYQDGPSNSQPAASRNRMNPPAYNESMPSGESSVGVIRSLDPSHSVDLKGRRSGYQSSSDTTGSSRNGTTSCGSPVPRRTQLVRESALSRFSGFTRARIGSDFGPSSVIGIGSAAIKSPTNSHARTNMMSVTGSIVGDDMIARSRGKAQKQVPVDLFL